MHFTKVSKLNGEITIPGDKSISHRAIMLGALSKGTTEVSNFLQGADCLSTIDCFRRMGIDINNTANSVTIKGKGLLGLTKPSQILDVGNSGTTTRIMSGILAAQSFETSLTGDTSIQKRPMGRIIEPLSLMGASITSINNNGCAPLLIRGSKLNGIHYISKVASAQVKSAILLAGLFAEGETSVSEPSVSRNHTEIMLKYFGGSIKTLGTTATVTPNPVLTGQKVTVPGDISSAAYFIVAGLIVPNSELLIKNVGINPTRDGIIRVCQQMGGDITLLNINDKNGEKTADILVKSSELTGIEIGGSIIPTLIDELPIISVLACFAKGKTMIKDAAELKVKESNRIDVCVNNLSAMNANVKATDDGMIITGGRSLHAAVLDSKLDHRIAMSFAVAGLMADGTTTIKNSECVNISYPTFYSDLAKLHA
ncbi:3-phosphoshikimate 1-carboxyvinyltransferase [Lachnotalea glycerini]|uniref:3-phosphoshikimate 1-carboxyvinyltransferase n=1 Tax=Lachnotalea glycerini TaxID=1763509 RepID=A0A318ESX5_9FIRM|nr:3-phosphoshikimate 1-carboxyvinyltransferase [Lachnotalea glycerini]PXV95392.1 3-phosphoshikimate 1-carboxyvinyltransferase [Lachnotalea glycerini]